MPLQDFAAVRVTFALPDRRPEASALKAKLQAADPTEQ
jgi:hypothetical protein